MEYSKLLKDLSLPDYWVTELEQRRDVTVQHQALIRELTDSATAADAYGRLDAALDKNEVDMLACQMAAACITRKRYEQMGISDDIFLDTMGCYRRFLGETLRRAGKHTFDRGWWSYRQLSMVLFRVGQLEYEMLEKEQVISVHIPSDSLIEPKLVDESLAAAKVFFAKYYPAYSNLPYVCESWLLSPELAEVLPEGSRILAFQRRFRMVKQEPGYNDFLEWLFSVPQNTPVADLPERTSLQRSIKSRLLAGGTVHGALGVME